MQRPTCTNIRIRSTHDAHKIFLAVQRKIMPMITRRLDADERLALCSGCIYAWEERGPHAEITGLGIERFTEGRRWSPSRVRDEFLLYFEKPSPSHDFQRDSSSKRSSRDWDPLVKQTYSVWIDTDKGRRKLHLTAYFSQATVDCLSTVDDIPGVCDLVVPEGLYTSTRVSKARRIEDSRRQNNSSPKSSATTVTRTYAAFPSALTATPVTSDRHYNLPLTLRNESQLLPPIKAVDDPDFGRFSQLEPVPYHPQKSLAVNERLPSHYGIRSSGNSGAQSTNESDHFRGLTHTSSIGYVYPSPPILNAKRELESPRSAVRSASLSRDMPGSVTSSTWYPPSPRSWDTGDRQLALPPARAEMPSPYTLRPSYHLSPESEPRDLGPLHGSSTDNYYGRSDVNGNAANHCTAFEYRSRRGSGSNASRSSSPATRSPMYDTISSLRASQSDTVEDSGSVGPCRGVDLAPLHSLRRAHPYRRDPMDDKALRLLGPRHA